MSTDKKKSVNPWLHFIAGGVGGTVGAVITCPLEVVKTRLQSSIYKNHSSTGLVGMLRNIYTQEGIKGLWRGLGPNLVGVVPARAIYFATYASTKDHLVKRISTDGSESPAIHLISAVCAGLATSTCTNPIWLIKTRMQLQTQPTNIALTSSCGSLSNGTISQQQQHQSQRPPAVKRISSAASISTTTVATTLANTSANSSSSQLYYKNSLDCLRKVVKQEGFFALFRGLSASYLGILEGTMQWIAYEQLKKIAKQQRINNSDISDLNSKKHFHVSDTFLAAGMAKFFAAITTYPHEVLRTRLRQAETISLVVDGKMTLTSRPKYNGIMHVLKTVWKEEGIMAFYGGLTAHVLRTVPNAAIMFLCYESMVFFVDDD